MNVKFSHHKLLNSLRHYRDRYMQNKLSTSTDSRPFLTHVTFIGILSIRAH